MKLDGGVKEYKKEVPEEAQDYPEVFVYGRILPAKGIYFRHIDGLTMDNVTVETYRKDKRGKSSAELEFIVESNNKLYPIDVKKGRGVLNSLEKFANHNKFEFAIKISKNNYGYNAEQKLLTIPFYFVPFIAKDFAEGHMN